MQILSIYPASKGRCHGKHFLAFYIRGAHWRHSANTTEPSVCGGDAALCQIALTTCFERAQFPYCSSAMQSVANVGLEIGR